LYFVHIASYGHTSPKCYTLEEKEAIFKAQENTDIAISENNVTRSKTTSNSDVLPSILISFFIIFAIFMFIFAFFYPLLIDRPEEIEQVQENPSQQEELDQKPDTVQTQNEYV